MIRTGDYSNVRVAIHAEDGTSIVLHNFCVSSNFFMMRMVPHSFRTQTQSPPHVPLMPRYSDTSKGGDPRTSMH